MLTSNADKAKALVARLAQGFPARARAVPDRLGPRARYRADHRARGARSGAVEEARCGGGPRAAGSSCDRDRRAMKVDGKHFRSIWREPDGWSVGAIDQRRLPHEFVVARLTNCAEAADAIRSMLVRGAPLIGATAAYGMALAMRDDSSDAAIERAYRHADRDAADRDQSEMGAGRDAARAAAAAAVGARRCRLCARRRYRRGRRRHQPGHRAKRPGADRGDRARRSRARRSTC